MAYMEFLGQNLCNTTTMLKVESNSTAALYLIDRNKYLAYQTSGYDSNTSTIISLEVGTGTVISNVLLQNHNFKNFRVFYNSVTANSIAVVTNNSSTNHYFNFASVTVGSVQVQIDTCITSGVEKSIGQIVIAEKELVFETNPSAKRYTPTIDRIQVKHIMADGGISLHNIKDKYKTKIKLEFISETFYNSMLSIFQRGTPLYFVPFPTSTSWDGTAHEVVWSGDFNFKFNENVKTIGYNGEFVLEETTNA